MKTYIKIQFAGLIQTFSFRFRIFKKHLGLDVHYLSKLIENTLSLVLNFVPRKLEIAFLGIEISKFSWGARPQTPLEEGK